MLEAKNGRQEKDGMKLAAQSQIEQPPTTASIRPGPPTADLGRFSKLKSMLGSGLKSQKPIPCPSGVQSGDMLEAQLTKLKSLYDSGALTETEYQQEKRKLLSEL
jgi:hypothetical protein